MLPYHSKKTITNKFLILYIRYNYKYNHSARLRYICLCTSVKSRWGSKIPWFWSNLTVKGLLWGSLRQIRCILAPEWSVTVHIAHVDCPRQFLWTKTFKNAFGGYFWYFSQQIHEDFDENEQNSQIWRRDHEISRNPQNRSKSTRNLLSKHIFWCELTERHVITVDF